MSGIVALIFVIGATAGLAYGIAAGTYRSDAQVMKGMAKAMETLGLYMVLVVFAAQFVAYFNWSNLGLIIAVSGGLDTGWTFYTPLSTSYTNTNAFLATVTMMYFYAGLGMREMNINRLRLAPLFIYAAMQMLWPMVRGVGQDGAQDCASSNWP